MSSDAAAEELADGVRRITNGKHVNVVTCRIQTAIRPLSKGTGGVSFMRHQPVWLAGDVSMRT